MWALKLSRRAGDSKNYPYYKNQMLVNYKSFLRAITLFLRLVSLGHVVQLLLFSLVPREALQQLRGHIYDHPRPTSKSNLIYVRLHGGNKIDKNVIPPALFGTTTFSLSNIVIEF